MLKVNSNIKYDIIRTASLFGVLNNFVLNATQRDAKYETTDSANSILYTTIYLLSITIAMIYNTIE